MSGINEQRDRLLELLREFNATPAADLRDQVLALIPVWDTLYELGKNLLPANVRNAARDRLLYYFSQYPNQVISRQELSVVSGISEWARRVRELRVEYGWAIYSGKTLSELPIDEQEDGWRNLRPDDYVMISLEQDRDAAYRWNLAKQIRNSSGGVKSKVLLFLRRNVGKAVTGEELRYVAGDRTEWARRVRELRTEEGWADRDFHNGDRVVFVGPPDEEFQPGMMPNPSSHKLYQCTGQIRIGVSEDILVYPDEPDADMYWVRFDDDTQPIRQVKGTWLVKKADC
jgi:hypothetical protein